MKNENNIDLFKLVIWIAIKLGLAPKTVAIIDDAKVRDYVKAMVIELDKFYEKRGLKVVRKPEPEAQDKKSNESK
jgi:hypothetical protein